MASHVPSPARKRRPLFTILAFVALIAQVAVALAPLGEHLSGSMRPHVEAPGAKGHFTHDEATCPACQARSIAGSTLYTPVAVVPTIRVQTADVAVVARVVAERHLHTTQSRAPPSKS